MTVSAGVAAFPDDGKTPAELLSAADSRLYRAKREGRDRVVAA
ncbi:MAG: diguanylate cyclase [Bacillota bacterium]